MNGIDVSPVLGMSVAQCGMFDAAAKAQSLDIDGDTNVEV